MSAGIHVLCVDDDPDIRSLTGTALERTSDDIGVTTASCSRDGLDLLTERGDIDCVVSDYEMPGQNGLEFLEAVREFDPELPFILFTGKGSEEIASEAISAGVTDYLQKQSGTDQYTVLANRIQNAVEKRRADRARRESERELEQYRTLVETVTDPMYVLDEMGCCTVANEAFCELIDVDRDRVVGEHILEFLSRESFERGVKTVRRLYRNGRKSERFEFTVLTDDGDRRIGEANVTVLTDDGDFAGSTAVIRDITSRKRRERELAQYERIIELAPIALFLLDDEANIIWLNDEFAAAFEEDVDELLEMTFPDLIDRGYYDDSVTTKYVEEVQKLLSSAYDHERAEYRVRFQAPNGEELVHDVHTRLLPLEDGEFTGTIHAIRDITQRRRYQRELERQNERLAEFASVVSHDLRNPLNVAQGSLGLHADECSRADDDSLEQIRRSLERMDELIEDLLSLARHGQTVGEPEPVSLSRVVHEAWEAVETDVASLECTVDATITADEGRLKALFENLFRNAVEHGSTSPDSQARRDSVEHSSTSPASQAQQDDVEHSSTSPDSHARRDAGRHTATSEPSVATAPEDGVEHSFTSSRSESDGAIEPPSDVTVTVGSFAETDEDGRPVRGFYVADDGPGLPSNADGLFEFGYTTAENGTGLGLAIVAEIAEAHDWRVTACDGPDGGARFEIRGVTLLEDGRTPE